MQVYSSLLDKSNYLSSLVLVGDEPLIPVTNQGHATVLLSNPYCTLTLKNILITPQIIKNLIFVCRFTCDYMVSIEFDLFGFSMKDL